MRFRPVRGGFKESMEETVQVANRPALVQAVKELCARGMIAFDETKLTFSEFHQKDLRNGWDTYYVLLDGHPVGFADGNFETPRP